MARRSVCHARTPKRENVEFYARPHDALYAGFRPCLRCRPLEARGRPPAVVEKLLSAVEAGPGERLREADLQRMGIDPSTARRAFQRYCGMSFHAYHRARRMGLALSGIRKGQTMLDLQLDQGFESSSGFREAFAKVFGTAPSQARGVDCLYAKWYETPLGPMLALGNDHGLYLKDSTGVERRIAVVGHDVAPAHFHGVEPDCLRCPIDQRLAYRVADGVADKLAGLEEVEIVTALPGALVVIVKDLALVVEADTARRAQAADGGDHFPLRRDAHAPAAERRLAGERAGQRQHDPELARAGVVLL